MIEHAARLDAAFASDGSGTYLTHRFAEAPLKIAKAFPRPGGETSVLVMDASPGLMAGDVYNQRYRLGMGSRVHVTGQSYTKVHPSRERPARQEQRFIVEREARLDLECQPVILYQDAGYDSKLELELQLAQGASALISEIVSPGRCLRGELFRYARYDSSLRVYDRSGEKRELIYANRLCFTPSAASAPGLPDASRPELRNSPGVWNGYTHLGSLYAFSKRVSAAWVEQVRTIASAETESEETASADMRVGVSLTYKHGLIVSAAATSVWQLERLLSSVRSSLKPLL